MIMSLKAFTYFSIGKIIFFPFACLWLENLKPGKMMFLFSEILIHTTVDFSHKKKCSFPAGICFIWKFMEYTHDHSPDISINPTF